MVVCVELAWPFRGMTDEMPGGARCSQPFLVLVCWSLLHSWTGWDSCTDMWVWIFHADFLVRIFGCGFWGADFFGFGVRIFSRILSWPVRILDADFFCGFFGCFPTEKTLKNPIKKSHRKILTKDLVRETFLHNAPPHSFWQDTADLLSQSGCRCTLWRTVFSAQMASVREDERVISTCV